MIEKVEISTTNQTILDLRELKDTLERNQDRELQKKLFEIKESDTYSNRSVDRLERFIIFDGQDYFLEFFPAYWYTFSTYDANWWMRTYKKIYSEFENSRLRYSGARDTLDAILKKSPLNKVDVIFLKTLL